jgi:hypothetical protein
MSDAYHVPEEEARILAQKKANGLRQYLGLSDVEEKRIRQRESLLDREVYGELRRCVRVWSTGTGQCVKTHVLIMAH